MRLTEEAPVAAEELPQAALAAHLHLHTGFHAPEGQEARLRDALRAALAAIEGRTGKAILSRVFRLELAAWGAPNHQFLPLAPVSEVVGVGVLETGGATRALAPEAYALIPDDHRPRLLARAAVWEPLAWGERVVLRFRAGFGASWGAVPADLQQAVVLLAAAYVEGAGDEGVRGVGLPTTVQSLIEPWRLIRILGGGRG